MLPAGRIDSAGPLPFGASLGEGEGSHRHLALENLALRQQLAVYKKTLRRPKLHPSDRLFWVFLSPVWAGCQQIVDTFRDDTAPSYLLRDRDAIYGEAFRQRVKGMQIREVLTAARSPWQNPFERLIGSIRRDCLDHVIVLSASATCVTS
jgi:hypothetical protein